MSSRPRSPIGLELPELPEAWHWRTLGSLVDPSRGICYGIVQPGKHDPAGVPMVNSGDVLDGQVNRQVQFRVADDLHSRSRRSALRGGELLVTLVGANFGQVAIAPPEYAGHNVARPVGVVPLIADAEFVMFALRSPVGRHFMDTWANTTAQPTLNLKDLANLPVPVPPAEVQSAITSVLSGLDRRIALLRETNATLEAIAQALFRSWFVDFDPVRAKSQGLAPAGMDEATAGLFPEGFEESALGSVPAGWQTGTVSHFAALQKGSVAPSERSDTVFEHYSLPAFDAGQLPVGERGAEIKSNKTPVPSNAVLLSKLNPHIPRIWLPFEAGPTAVCSTEFLVFMPTTEATKEFVYCTFSAPQFQERLRQLVTGTSNSHQRVKPDGVLALRVVMPPEPLVDAFTSFTKPMLERVGRNRLEMQTLADLRDALLPRLISGRLRMPEVEAIAESAL